MNIHNTITVEKLKLAKSKGHEETATKATEKVVIPTSNTSAFKEGGGEGRGRRSIQRSRGRAGDAVARV